MTIRYAGKKECEILFITEPSNESMTDFVKSEAGQILIEELNNCGINYRKCAFISAGSDFPANTKGSDGRKKEFLDNDSETFKEIFNKFNPKMYVYFGAWAGKRLGNKMLSSSPAPEGSIVSPPWLKKPVLGVNSIRSAVSTHRGLEIFRSYINLIRKLKNKKYEFKEDMYDADATNYEWRVDISDVLKNRPKVIAFDTETTGLKWTSVSVYPIVFQMTFEDGQSLCSPVSSDYFPEYFKDKFGDYDQDVLIQQWKELLEDPNVKKVGHNMKFDMHMISKLGIDLKGFYYDTLQMVCAIDENMDKKGLDYCVKRWVPEMQSYADRFNMHIDKSNMLSVHPDEMITYAGGDTDATFRLARVLERIAKTDKKNFNVFKKVKMEGIKTFYKIEKNGIPINYEKLKEATKETIKEKQELHRECLKLAPKKVLRKFMWGIYKGKDKKEDKRLKTDPLRLNNSSLVSEILFSRDGFDLTPRIFTDGTKSLEDKNKKIPAINLKHLAYFVDENIDFIDKFMTYSKTSHMISNFMGIDDPKDLKRNGYRSHLVEDHKDRTHRIHSTFNLHTDTGRCLVEGTKVKLTRGAKNIEDIKVGDEVITHTGEIQTVTKFFDNGKKEVMGLQFADNSEIWGTFNHKLMNSEGKWKQMQYFDIGMKVKAFRSGKFIAKRIKGVMYNKNKKSTYDIEVKGNHSFIANGIVSHNSKSSDPNVQNIPSHGSLAKRLKKCIEAPHGKVLLALDYSQAEIRVVACTAHDKTMIDTYNQGLDIHIKTAANVVQGISVEEFMSQDKAERKSARQRAKAVNFGFLYGMQARKYMTYAKTDYGIDVTEEEANELRRRFLNDTYSSLSHWHSSTVTKARRSEIVRSLHGSTRHVPGVNLHDSYLASEWERQAINSPIQEFASDLGIIAMTNIIKDLNDPDVKIFNFVHDAIYVEVPVEKAFYYASAIKWYMENPPLKEMFGLELPIPLGADCEIGFNLGETVELADLDEEGVKEFNKDNRFGDHTKHFDYVEGAAVLKAIKPDWCTL